MNSLPQVVTPLRQRMLDDMRMRKLCDKTQTGYMRAVRQLAAFLERSPDTATVEDLRRSQLHVLPSVFHRIRHYGLLANAGCRQNLARTRELLDVVPDAAEPQPFDAPVASVPPTFVCPHCGAAMIIVETFVRGDPIRAPRLCSFEIRGTPCLVSQHKQIHPLG
ncbi:MAG: phage integrase N-terminal SAM-like domain-containing protein [Bradyrhizobium sp.]